MKRTAAIIIGLILIGALIAGVVFALNNDGDNGDVPTEVVTQPPVVEEQVVDAEPIVTEQPTEEATPEPVTTEEATEGPTEEPTEAPEPVATEELTEEPPPDPCAEHGGVQWMGETCLNSGVIDEVVICTDGTQFDTVTERGCTPTGGASGDEGDGNGSGGGWVPPPPPTPSDD